MRVAQTINHLSVNCANTTSPQKLFRSTGLTVLNKQAANQACCCRHLKVKLLAYSRSGKLTYNPLTKNLSKVLSLINASTFAGSYSLEDAYEKINSWAGEDKHFRP